jgi:hypothetical protein
MYSLGLDQEKHLTQTPHVDIGSNAPSLREAWPHMDDGTTPDRPVSDRASSTARSKKKRRGLGRLWKIITGAPSKTHERPYAERRPAHEDEDEPLAPPPPLSYLVNRGSAQSERSMNMMGQGRHVSMPSLTYKLKRAAASPLKLGSERRGRHRQLPERSEQLTTLPDGGAFSVSGQQRRRARGRRIRG